MDLGFIFGGRSGEKPRKKCVAKHAFFRYRFFSVFLRFLAILLGFWDAPGPQKIEKNQKKSIFRRVKFWRRVLGRFWGSFGRILKGFWMDFNGIWGRFLKLFERIWKDKQWLGRPRERQEVLIIGRVVGWSGRVPKGLTCVGARTWAVGSGGSFFSTYFREGFWSVFFYFLRILGGFGRPKWE